MLNGDSLPPETKNAYQALEDLELVLDNLRQGASDWRRRALKAEAERARVDGGDTIQVRQRVKQLEDDNVALHERLDAARGRVHELLARLRFLEEQVALEERT